MQPEHWEILVLKPSPTFISFLRQHFPQRTIPDYGLLQSNNTAYLFHRRYSDEELLDEIELQYQPMFRYEIQRWLGDEALHQNIEASFLDFLCCFKFEMHAHLLMMEECLLDAKQLLCVKPRSTMIKWLKEQLNEAVATADEDLITTVDVGYVDQINQWTENGTVLIKNLPSIYELKSFVKSHYDQLLESEMVRLCHGLKVWPEIDSYQMFCRYFVVEYHTHLIHLT